jgi:hypothetical protein
MVGRVIRKWASGARDALAPGTGKELPMQAERMRGESVKQVAINVHRGARKPLHTKEPEPYVYAK